VPACFNRAEAAPRERAPDVHVEKQRDLLFPSIGCRTM
jgi:hypothetical protein